MEPAGVFNNLVHRLELTLQLQHPTNIRCSFYQIVGDGLGETNILVSGKLIIMINTLRLFNTKVLRVHHKVV